MIDQHRARAIYVPKALRNVFAPIFIACLVLAAVLRLASLDLIDLRYDEAVAAVLAQNIAHGARYLVVPNSGSVANHPPLWIYLLAVPYTFSKSLLVAAGWRVLWDLAAVAVCGVLCQRAFGWRTAVVAMLFFSVNPWAIWFSRKLGVAASPLSSAVILWGFIEVFQRKNFRGWFIASIGMATALASHLSSLFFLPAYILVTLLALKNRDRKNPLLALLPIIVVLVAIAAIDASRGFPGLSAIGRSTSDLVRTDVDGVRFATWMTGGAHLSDITAESFPIWADQPIQMLAWIDIMQQFLAVVSIFALAVVLMNSRLQKVLGVERSVLAILLLWIAVPLVLYVRHTGAMQVHYLVLIWPAPFIVIALGLRLSWRIVGPIQRTGLTIICVGIVIWHVVTTFRFNDFVESVPTSAHVPARVRLDAAASATRMVCRTANDCEPKVIVLANGDDPLVDPEVTVWAAALGDVQARFVDARQAVLAPGSPASIIGSDGPDVRTGMSELRLISTGFGSSSETTLGHTVSVSAVEGNSGVRGALRLAGAVEDVPAVWENGVELLGVQSVTSGGNERITVWLMVTKLQVDGRDFHWTHRKFVNGAQVWQRDIGGVRARNWRVGDVLVHHFDMPATGIGELEQIRIGQYSYPAIQAVTVLTSKGSFEDGVTVDLP